MVAAACVIAVLGDSPVARAQPKEKDDATDVQQDLELRRRLEPLIPSVRAALQGNNPDAQRAALVVIADFPPALMFQANFSGLVAAFLDRDPKDPELAAIALRSYGKSYPEKPDAAAKRLQRFTQADDVRVRRAAADALTSLVQTSIPASRTIDHATGFIDTSAAALPVMADTLADKDGAVQRAILTGVQSAAQTVRDVLNFDVGIFSDDPKPRDRAARLTALRPALNGLAAVVPQLAHPLASADPATRTAAARTIERLADLRQAVLVGPPGGGAPPADPLAEAWAALVPAVGERMRDPDPLVRLAVTEALEALGSAIDSRPMLRAATRDPNVLVRWAAARALGKMAPAKADPAGVADDVAALSRLTADADIDVRMAALNALARFGTAARPAAPAVLVAAGRGDVEPRVVAMRTLIAMESEAEPTLPVLIGGLTDPDVRVRRAAAGGLVRFGPAARPALPELRRAVLSTDSELRIAAAEAILAIERQPRLKDL
jgi:HEAT repeat protein